MPRWTKENWAKLDADERSLLMDLLKRLKGSTYSDPYFPDDVSCCPGCGEPIQLCNCQETLDSLCAKMGVPSPDI